MDDGERLLRDMGRVAREDEVSRPLGPDFERRMVARLQAETTASRRAEPAPAFGGVRGRWGARSGWGRLGAAALAAAVVFFVVTGWFAAVPSYDLVDAEGSRAIRGASGDAAVPAGEPLHLVPGAGFRLRLAPRAAVAGPLRVRVFVARGSDGAPPLDELRVETRRAPGGMLEVVGDLEAELPGPDGPRTLVVLVGRPWTRLDPRTAATAGEGIFVLRRPAVYAAR